MSDWPDRRFAGLLGSRLPMIAAPMAGAAGVELAVAAIAGGAVGSLPCAMLSAGEARAQVDEVRARAAGPLNLNFFCHDMPPDVDDAAWRALLRPYFDELGLDPSAAAPATRRPFDEEMCALVENVRPELVSFHFGLPAADLLERVRKAGARIIGNATSLAEARFLAAAGVDAITAQGWEAGGHAGRFLGAPIEEHMGLFALVPQMADQTGLPVVAAGGIADGRTMAAALILGAAAVQIGTAFLHCPECLIGAAHRAALSSPAAERTAFTNLYSGGRARSLPTRLTDDLGRIRDEVPPFPMAASVLGPLAKEASARGESGFAPMWAGQAAGLGRPEPARELVERLGRESLALLIRKD